MIFDLSFKAAEGYIVLRIEGEWNPVTLQQVAKDTAKRAKELRCKQILVDARKLGAPKNEFDRFRMGEQIAEIFGPLVKLAVVYPEKLINQFAENTAVNRGANMTVFSNVDEAVSWLTQDFRQ